MSIREFWKSHGTKLIGFATAAVGALEFLDASTIHLIEASLGSKWGPAVSHGILIASGLMTAYRGFTNSRNTRNVPPLPSSSSIAPGGGS